MQCTAGRVVVKCESAMVNWRWLWTLSHTLMIFRQLARPRGRLCTNPITGGAFVYGEDPIGSQKRAACRALAAREWFTRHAPADAPPLPLSYEERENMKHGGGGPLLRIVAWYARSLEARKYDFDEHPPFEDYVRGVLASDYAPYFIKDADLMKRYPPCPLPGLGSGLYWDPPKRERRCRRRQLQYGRRCADGTAPGTTPAGLRS
jgi:hypothetical protein